MSPERKNPENGSMFHFPPVHSTYNSLKKNLISFLICSEFHLFLYSRDLVSSFSIFNQSYKKILSHFPLVSLPILCF